MNYPNTTQIPNKIIDKWLPELKKGARLPVLLFVCRQTIGWIKDEETGRRKKEDWTTQKQLKKKTGYSAGSVSEAIKWLIKNNLLEVRCEGKILKTPKERSKAGRKHKKLKYRIPLYAGHGDDKGYHGDDKDAYHDGDTSKTNTLNKTNNIQGGKGSQNLSDSPKNSSKGTKAKELLDYFVKRYKENIHSDGPHIQWKKSMKLAKSYLKEFSLERMKRFVDIYFTLGDKFYEENKWSVNIFLSSATIHKLKIEDAEERRQQEKRKKQKTS